MTTKSKCISRLMIVTPANYLFGEFVFVCFVCTWLWFVLKHKF